MVPDCTIDIPNPLHQIVAILGSLEARPANILKLIFIDEFTNQNIFQILCFFYGNKVSHGLAISFFVECCDRNWISAVTSMCFIGEICNYIQTACVNFVHIIT
jgi:hypothetical protein